MLQTLPVVKGTVVVPTVILILLLQKWGLKLESLPYSTVLTPLLKGPPAVPTLFLAQFLHRRLTPKEVPNRYQPLLGQGTVGPTAMPLTKPGPEV